MKSWIPPLPLALAMSAFGLSWLLLYRAAATLSSGVSFTALAWVHAVALGWITLVALSVLQHVIPAFLDVEWRSRPIGRGFILVFAFGAAALIAGFVGPSATLLQGGAFVAVLAIVVYALTACEPLGAAMRRGGTGRAVARAFGGTLLFLLLAALLGAIAALGLSGTVPATWLERLPPAHAVLAIGGWLSLLVVGVSARTMGPIAGMRSSRVRVHIGSSTTLLAGILLAGIAAILHLKSAAVVGCVLLLAGIALYAFDLLTVLARATVSHRPPQVLMACAALAAVASAALAIGAATGKPYGAAAVYVALLGWTGNAVLAHLHHIGVRVLLTTVRGEDDETRPQQVLIAPLSWLTVLAYQAAIVLGALAALRGDGALLRIAADAGFIAFLVMLTNVAAAYRNASLHAKTT
ncbi:MAG: hypothetical protein JO030_08920 [Candidatus Eremiobacteraeota bacterium]|nr:hypothetical protein [Candidatus Eremiobacteraeota bacterium]